MSNPETIEIQGLSTIHKLCKFGADNNMEGCSFTEIVERMFAELAKSQAVPEGFVLVPKEPTTHQVDYCQTMKFRKGVGRSHKFEDIFVYKAMIEAQEQSHD